MKPSFILIIILFILFSCKKTEKETRNASLSSNPIEDVIWLKEMKSSMTDCSCEHCIIQGSYNGQTVYYVALTDALCDGIDTPTLYDNFGRVVKIFTMADYREFYILVSRDKVLYRCKNQ